MTLFGRYVSPQIANAIWRDRDTLLAQGRLKGQKLKATVLFTDIKNFSVLTNKLEPEELMDWLNEYMEAMSEVVLANGGVVDKFIGDAVMAVFRSQGFAQAAVIGQLDKGAAGVQVS